MSDTGLSTHQVAGMIALGAVIFLLLIEKGFRGFDINA